MVPPVDEGGNAASRLDRQIAFLLEIDGLKEVLRRSYRLSGKGRENSAEHSWHLVMMAMLLAEHANESVSMERVMKMVAVHDLVEIDAGDTFAYDAAGQEDKATREEAAAERLFGILPDDQGTELAELWAEFEAQMTPDARFARSMDLLMPLLHNFHTQGRSWREHRVVAEQVRALHSVSVLGSEVLARYANGLINEAIRRGYLPDEAGSRDGR